MTMKKKYYTPHNKNGLVKWSLVFSDKSWDTLNEMEQKMENEESEGWKHKGKLNEKPRTLSVVNESEVSGVTYDKEYLSEERKNSMPLEYDKQGPGVLVSERFLEALITAGLKEYRAYPIILTHKKTKRKWEDYWYVRFTAEKFTYLLDGSEVVFVGKEISNSYTFYSEEAKSAVDDLGIKNLLFDPVEIELSKAKPMSSYDDIDKRVLKLLKKLWKEKAPKADKDSNYGIGKYFLPKLQEKYSDIEAKTLDKIIKKDSEKTFIFNRKEEMIGINKESKFYKTLK